MSSPELVINDIFSFKLAHVEVRERWGKSHPHRSSSGLNIQLVVKLKHIVCKYKSVYRPK